MVPATSGAETRPPDATTLVLIRHGEAVDTQGRCIGHADVVLSEAGADAIDLLATRWRNAGGESTTGAPTRIVSSDLQRASSSARIVAARWNLSVERDARLREMHFGEWDGRLWSEIESADGARLRAWTEDWTNSATPGGEGLADVMQRAESWLSGALHSSAPNGSVIVVVSHAGWIRAAISRLLDLPQAEIFRLAVDYARATIVSVRSSGVELVASNVVEVP